mmetsp:Transcript_26640/g.89660  ORF Transcript_26640/g.89660 Transcript_26640/m.89660 type:complete len:253 (-) Transcript_26640:76-834(-)
MSCTNSGASNKSSLAPSRFRESSSSTALKRRTCGRRANEQAFKTRMNVFGSINLSRARVSLATAVSSSLAASAVPVAAEASAIAEASVASEASLICWSLSRGATSGVPSKAASSSAFVFCFRASNLSAVSLSKALLAHCRRAAFSASQTRSSQTTRRGGAADAIAKGRRAARARRLAAAARQVADKGEATGLRALLGKVTSRAATEAASSTRRHASTTFAICDPSRCASRGHAVTAISSTKSAASTPTAPVE